MAMSAATKAKRLDGIDGRIKRAEEKARELREAAIQLTVTVQRLRAEQEWLQSAPVSDPDTDEQEGPPA